MFTINWNIMDVVIDIILFNVDDEESARTHERALLIFKLFEGANNYQIELGGEEDLNHKVYKVEINSL